jgi:cytochrome c biogenesis protein CcmG, thiol:disulfide interchange protein DsbE
MRRRLLWALGAVALAAVVVIGLSQTGTDNSAPKASTLSAADAQRDLAGAPAPLAGLHAQAGQLVDGSKADVRARLADLRGHPVVVNKWASWCGPCRLEFPFFRDQAKKRKGEIAFIGVNSNDSHSDAEKFLKEEPVPYRHFDDPRLEIAAAFNAVQAFPSTAFYDSKGELAFVHQGGYASEDDLAEDIERYAR